MYMAFKASITYDMVSVTVSSLKTLTLLAEVLQFSSCMGRHVSSHETLACCIY